jgi:hypothetical protein
VFTDRNRTRTSSFPWFYEPFSNVALPDESAALLDPNDISSVSSRLPDACLCIEIVHEPNFDGLIRNNSNPIKDDTSRCFVLAKSEGNRFQIFFDRFSSGFIFNFVLSILTVINFEVFPLTGTSMIADYCLRNVVPRSDAASNTENRP